MVWTKQKEAILRVDGKKCTELYKKDLNDPDNHDSIINHLEPDILDYEMKFVTLYRRQGSRPSPWKRNAKNKMAVRL